MFNNLWKEKTRSFFSKIFNETRKRFFASRLQSQIENVEWRNRGSFETIDPDRSKIHDLFSVDKDSVILTRHIQGVQKYGIKFFNTKLTYFQKERIINNYQFIFAIWKCENEYFEKIDKTIEFYFPIFQLF